MTIQERLQIAYINGRKSASLQICDHLGTLAEAMAEQDPVGAAALKYAAAFANETSNLEPDYEEES